LRSNEKRGEKILNAITHIDHVYLSKKALEGGNARKRGFGGLIQKAWRTPFVFVGKS